MAINIISSDNFSGKIYKHDGFSSTVIDSFSSPSTFVTGVAWNGTDIYSSDIVTNKIYQHSGFSSTVINSFSGPSTGIAGISWDGTDLYSADAASDDIYQHNGFSSVITDSFSSPSTNPTSVSLSGSNLLSVDSNSNKVYLHDGFSSTIVNSFSSHNSMWGVTFDGTNVILADELSDKIYQHQGFSSTVIDSFSSPSTSLRDIDILSTSSSSSSSSTSSSSSSSSTSSSSSSSSTSSSSSSSSSSLSSLSSSSISSISISSSSESSSPDLSRIHYWHYVIAEDGTPIQDAEVRFYLNGTTTEANIFLSETATTYTTTSNADLKTDADGFFEFWLENGWESGGYNHDQQFKLEWFKAGARPTSISNINPWPNAFKWEDIRVGSDKNHQNKFISDFYGNKWWSHLESIVPSASPHNLGPVNLANICTDDVYNKVLSNKFGYDILDIASTYGSVTVASQDVVEDRYDITSWDPSGGFYYTDVTHSNVNSKYVSLHVKRASDSQIIEPKDIVHLNTSTTRVFMDFEVDVDICVHGQE